MNGYRALVAIVDFGLGNLFSVKQACDHVGMNGFVTSDKDEILGADLVVLPGVGAFGDAMDSLRRLDLVSVLRDVAASNTPLVGICLGLQLLMSESHEFGRHKGLGIVAGEVVRFESTRGPGRVLKVPHIGWNRIMSPPGMRGAETNDQSEQAAWADTPLAGLADGEFMYFVHSYYAKPEDTQSGVSVTRYGDTEFCSSLKFRSVFACQFHPERSGSHGLRVYRNLAASLALARVEGDNG